MPAEIQAGVSVQLIVQGTKVVVKLVYEPALVDEVARRCTEVESGARNVDNILTNTLLPQISRRLLTGMAEGEKIATIQVSVGADSSFVYA